MQKIESKKKRILVPVILSGGSGTRLWPMSRQYYPKQFIPLLGEESLFQATLQRLQGLENLVSPIVVSNQEYRFMAAEQLRQIGIEDGSILLEPMARNTAPAIAAAALDVVDRFEDGVMLVLPADHMIRDVAAFHSTVVDGLEAAEQGCLVTFGTVPNRPETGYGYICQGENAGLEQMTQAVFKVARFVEKPDLSQAEDYLASGDYLWNSGMFMFKASHYLRELQAQAPQIYEACTEAYQKRYSDLHFVRLDSASFKKSPSDSIDYAVMERTGDAVVIPLQAGWSDVGSWNSLWQSEPHDQMDNIAVGDVVSDDCDRCYINANHRLVAAIGLKDTIVVETADAVLVTSRERAQDVRLMVDRLKSKGRAEARFHRKVYRPWGTYEEIDIATRFRVKRITVNPGHTLSLQMHHHRAEHWIVVKGTAQVTRGEEILLLSENESTYIPIGTRHRMENPGKIPLELIEVQSGSYLGEDDIVRFEDKYGR
ncbi:MAG: mannose-1-phosphate guanylyltransferase/mannose-6-phosphate isomerase [Gammaproteobacteria bacterium]|nr:mannose-1-phosphate guanylyltransferase/mannose-6-phosphate isomerase [Gammaproteobacteria bacterium]